MAELLLPTMPSLLMNRRSPLIHRDLSWIQFNDRVLAEAKNSQNPLLERLKFLGITSSNLDEFFMIRFASLNRKLIRLKKETDLQEGRRLLRIRANLLESVKKFISHQTLAFNQLATAASKENIFFGTKSRAGDEAFEIGKSLFASKILPFLSPPEPFVVTKIQGLENFQLAVQFQQTQLFKISKSIPFLFVATSASSKKTYIFFLDDLLLAHLGEAFRIIGNPGLVRLTRDGDVGLDLEEEDPETIPEVVAKQIGSRERGRAMRLQWRGDVPDALIRRFIHLLKISSQEVFQAPISLVLHGLTQASSQIESKEPSLRFQPLAHNIPQGLHSSAKIFDHLKVRDFILHHPYDSFDGFVNLIKAAVEDPQVVMIEQTIYRMDAVSAILDLLKKAAKTKKVRAIIELRARFDELNNLKIAEELRRAGAEVAFGFGKLKLHAKVALITRNEPTGTHLYTHLSTGNYNSQTARQYTDLALFTSNAEIGADARNFFDAAWNHREPSGFKQLVSAPSRLHRKLISLIETEIQAAQSGKPARIVAKVNAMVDQAVTDLLYRASQAGVQIDLIVRGACSLVPGIKGLSENVRVISVVDRFLEHSRIYYFMSSRALYLSSADWMPRNFFSRLELAFPILDERIYKFIEEVVIPIYLLDTVKASELTPQGIWKRRSRSLLKKSDIVPEFMKGHIEPVNAQKVFEELARSGYKGTPLARIK